MNNGDYPRTMFSALNGGLIIEETNEHISEANCGWQLVDSESDDEIDIHPDDIPELIAMLEAFQAEMDENRDDVTVMSDQPQPQTQLPISLEF